MDDYYINTDRSPTNDYTNNVDNTVSPSVVSQLASPSANQIQAPLMTTPVPVRQNHTAVKIQGTNWVKRIIKFLVVGLVVGLVAYYFGRNKLTTKEIIIIALVAAIIFAIVDVYSPTVTINNVSSC